MNGSVPLTELQEVGKTADTPTTVKNKPFTATISAASLVEVLSHWQAGDEIVLSGDGIKINGHLLKTSSRCSPNSGAKNIFKLEGNVWQIRYEHEQAFFRDVRGLQHIHALLC